MHYDFAITCRASINPDATGIGLTTRLLLQAHALAGRRCVIFGENPPEPGFTADCLHPVRHVQVGRLKTPAYDNLRTPELVYSHALFLCIDEVLRDHPIRLIEFPDFEAEGWAFIHYNLVYRRIPCVVVRLHGARFILDEDNALRTTPLQTALLHAGELEAIRRADHVLYSGEALRERVLASYSPRESVGLRNRCALLPAPVAAIAATPARTPGAVRRVGCIGPLEYRLGADLLVINAVRHFQSHPESPLEIHCLGPDTSTADGDSFRDYLLRLVPAALAARFEIESIPSSAGLAARAAACDAFVFPARFSADTSLLSSIPEHGSPLLVSNRGDLPALAATRLGMCAFDPLAADIWPGVFATLESSATSPGTCLREQPTVDLTGYSCLGDTPAPVLRPVRLSIVTPHLNDADNLQSLLDRFAACPHRDRLEIFVVDDGSTPDVFKRVETICSAHASVTLLRTPRPRCGPFEARLIALRAATADFVALVDCDDYIDTERYLHYASVLDQNPGLDVILPAMRFFGSQNHDWLPGPKNRVTLLAEPFAHIGLLARKISLLNAFIRAEPSAHLASHGEDWLHACSLIFNGAQVATVPEVAYYYNRTNPSSRSSVRFFMRWHGNAVLQSHYERSLTSAQNDGTLLASDLRTLLCLSRALGDDQAAQLAARGNRVPWHTHLFRAFRSLVGDRRYRP
jgi:hypothetical protein